MLKRFVRWLVLSLFAVIAAHAQVNATLSASPALHSRSLQVRGYFPVYGITSDGHPLCSQAIS